MKSSSQRIESLDILRGCALMGILIVNIALFAIPANFPIGYPSDHTQINKSVWAVVQILFDGKMRAIFCMLFGASAMLFLGKGGVDQIDLYMRRNFGWPFSEQSMRMLFGLTMFFIFTE